ncbi:hypothetical protein GGQ88_001916 [Novosphingobium hassiacum]|uniref:Uncharacterized protein n=1 Tax=Novosphingobium hassiacum TaxID=173676 RepID=A0A7W5ZVD0_9SPHN|nr:hypothetical protein [Novosphingobium hassiacum]
MCPCKLSAASTLQRLRRCEHWQEKALPYWSFVRVSRISDLDVALTKIASIGLDFGTPSRAKRRGSASSCDVPDRLCGGTRSVVDRRKQPCGLSSPIPATGLSAVTGPQLPLRGQTHLALALPTAMALSIDALTLLWRRMEELRSKHYTAQNARYQGFPASMEASSRGLGGAGGIHSSPLLC